MPGKLIASSVNATEQKRGSLTPSQVHTLTDASEHAACQQWLDLEMHQLSAGQYQASCTSIKLGKGNTQIFYEDQNQTVHKTGIMPKNMCTFSMVYSTDPDLRFSQFSNPLDSWLFFLPEETEFDVKVPGCIETFYVSLEQDKLLESARILNERYWDNPPKDLHAFNATANQKLAADMAALLKHSRAAGIAPRTGASSTNEKMLVDSLLLALNDATEILTGNTPEYHAHQRVRQLVWTAREFIDASLIAGHVPSVVEICAQTGVSERTLQYAFRRAMQVTPVAYLRILRLNRVRTELLNAETPDITVTRVATTWGFLHLGKFSQDYRRMFGELPSETLARATSSL